MEKPYPYLPVYKGRLSECDDKPTILHCNLLFPLLSVQQNKPESEYKNLQWNRRTLYAEHDDANDDEISSTSRDGYAADDTSSKPTD